MNGDKQKRSKITIIAIAKTAMDFVVGITKVILFFGTVGVLFYGLCLLTPLKIAQHFHLGDYTSDFCFIWWIGLAGLVFAFYWIAEKFHENKKMEENREEMKN